MSRRIALHRLSSIASHVCIVMIFAIPLGLALMWANIEIFADAIMGQLGLPAPVDGFSPLTRFLGWLCTMIPGGIMVWGLSEVRRMLQETAAGHYFSLSAVCHFRRFSWAMLLYAGALPVQSAFLSVVLTMHNPPGERMLAIRLGTTELNALFVAILFVIIAHVLEEGRKIADENATFL